MNKFMLCYIEEQYVNYLRKFDKKVFYNKNGTRPYVGVIFKQNNFYYYAPLASPKLKHLSMNPKAIDIYMIKNGELGVVNFNNMIPVPSSCLINCFSFDLDRRYKNLLENQLTYLNNHKKDVLNKVKRFREQYHHRYLNNRIMNRCCNFMLLEEKCLEYESLFIKS